MTTSSEDALKSLLTLEETELANYCKEISVDGVIAQVLNLKLNKGQGLWVSRGGLLAYQGVDWHLAVPGGAGKAIGRMMSGEGAALTRVTAQKDDASVVISANQPGKLATWDLDKGDIICTSGSFVAALGDVDISVTMARSAGAMFFGGTGLFMQRLSGSGIAVVHGAGDFVPVELGEGESVLVSTGNLAVFSGSVKYGIRRTGGCLKSMFGGEGIFMTELTGPGWVMLQSLKKLPMQPKQGGQ